MLVRESHVVNQEDLGKRLEEFCFDKFNYLTTRKGTKKAIKRNVILVNGEILHGSYYVQLYDDVTLIESLKPVPFKVFPLEIDVLFEDDFLAVINKPPGYPVNGNYFKTIEHALPYNLSKSPCQDALPYPLPCHRLDRSTSGCLIVAKTVSSRVHIGDQFKKRGVSKMYHALIVGLGKIPEEMFTDIDGKKAHSRIKVLRAIPSLSNNQITLVSLIPHTGRTHQLRIHCADAGFPILGDPLYGKPKSLLKGKGLFLCSTMVSFIHPSTGNRIEVFCPIPAKFDSFLEREKRRALL